MAFDNVRERESHAKEKHPEELAKLVSETITIDDDEGTTAGNKNQNEAPPTTSGVPKAAEGCQFRELGQVSFKASKRKRSEEGCQDLPAAKKQALISNFFRPGEISKSARRKSDDRESGSVLSGSIHSAESGSIDSGSVQSGLIPSGSGSAQSGSILSGSIQSGSIHSGSIQSGSVQSGTISDEDLAEHSVPRRKSVGASDDEVTRKIRQQYIREHSCKTCIDEKGLFVREGHCEHFTHKTPIMKLKDIKSRIVAVSASESGSTGSATPRHTNS